MVHGKDFVVRCPFYILLRLEDTVRRIEVGRGEDARTLNLYLALSW